MAAARTRINGLVPQSIDVLAQGLASEDEKHAFGVARFVIDHATDSDGDSLSSPLPSEAQVAEWLERLEAEANR